MSLWRRWLGRRRPASGGRAPGSAPEAPQAADVAAIEAVLGGDNSAARLVEAGAALDRLVEAGAGATAVEWLARLGAARPGSEWDERLARLSAARGDDDLAGRAVARLLAADRGHLAAWMLAAELAERRGELAGAVRCYEEVLARDLGYAGARERHRRLVPPRRAASSEHGTVLGAARGVGRRYRLEGELGRGGAGLVFLAVDTRLGRRLALKLYHARGAEARDRLCREASAAGRIEHPGVVEVFDVEPGQGALAMEYAAGGSVRGAIARGEVGQERAVRWVRELAAVMEALAAQGLVHRDVKPSNLLLRASDALVLTDFGLACDAGGAATGVGEGSVPYAAPEQWEGGVPRPSLDVHAFGATARELLAAAGVSAPREVAEALAASGAVDPEARPSMAALRALLAAWR